MKALVISGGGSKGAFAGGIAEYLINTKKTDYDIFVGTSVGSLLISHLALGKISDLKTIFTNITNKAIFNIYPFTVRNNTAIKINHFNMIRAFIRGCSTFGESKNLRKVIKKTISEADFQTIKQSSHVTCTVSNLTNQLVEYKEAKNCNYDDFCDWIWASANVVPFMSLLNKNGCQYADGGFGSHVPVLYAIEQGAVEIDVINLDNQVQKIKKQSYVNPFQTLMGVFKFMNNQSGLKDILIGRLKGREQKIDVKIWHSPEVLTNNPLYFDPVLLKKWWNDGFEYAQKSEPICHCFMPNGDVIDM
jgi:predicted patatin/cPLA2 family phospholipase